MVFLPERPIPVGMVAMKWECAAENPENHEIPENSEYSGAGYDSLIISVHEVVLTSLYKKKQWKHLNRCIL